MKLEERVWKASIMAGITDLVFGLIMCLTGWHAWYFAHFHTFGIMGQSLIAYGIWHKVLIWTESRKN